ncbi:hypothetical protein SNE40_012459 [Patella caerulea]|uniref:NAD(P)(+)--arginine ADP-ribosyltransferase n=1 Tax=Patella caerulea TaxID=87958 RepID=A0AAN8JLR5_PATCE
MAKQIEGSPRMRFEGEVDLVPYNTRSGIATFSKPTTESDNALEDALHGETAVNPSFREAWNAAGQSSRLSNLVQKYKAILKSSEIKLIMAYTHGGITGFFSELNGDFRQNALTGGRFPNAKRILRNALIELGKFQKKEGKKLPDVLYRWEPSFLAKKYNDKKDRELHLNMFTSTSLGKSCNFNPQNNMLVEFVAPETGAFIRDFSFIPDEDEVLLPPLHGKIKVIKARSDESIFKGPFL